MQPIDAAAATSRLQAFVGQAVYVHLETTRGAYADNATGASIAGALGAFIRNARVQIRSGAIKGTGPFRAGLETDNGWIYAEGLTDWEVDAAGRLLLAGHDEKGRLAVALELSAAPLPM